MPTFRFLPLSTLLLLLTSLTAFRLPIRQLSSSPWSKGTLRQHHDDVTKLFGIKSPFAILDGLWPNQNNVFSPLLSKRLQPPDKKDSLSKKVVESWIQALNQGNIEQMLQLLSTDCSWEDYSFASSPFQGKDAVERHFRLLQSTSLQQQQFEIKDMIISNQNVGLLVECSRKDQKKRRGCVHLRLDQDCIQIQNVTLVLEPDAKGGEANLKLLSLVSTLFPGTAASDNPNDTNPTRIDASSKSITTAPERYFEAWNRRDMDAAIDVFTDNVNYDDTAFPKPFCGKDKLKAHLLLCAEAFPTTFTFQVDQTVASNKAVMVQWHVENKGQPLPFTRGYSYYQLDDTSGLIMDGIDFVEPAGVPLKPGGIQLFLDSMQAKLAVEPIRFLPIVTWVAYVWIVFFSDGILPGANALALEERTWKEVLDLSLNFFLVSPLLHLPFSPVVHPMLEGVFNLLLSWAAMFAGFFSDDRRDKPNLLPMIPTVVGMQFLTSAFLLPYLATRTTEDKTDVNLNDLSPLSRICESPALGIAMGVIGSASIAWFVEGRMEDFGSLAERWASFMDLLSMDRVGSSFVVDLAIFALFQGWLVEDDLKRRGYVASELPLLAFAAKYVPFFGMAAYLVFRPRFPMDERTN